MNDSISRRTVIRGAAWSVPVIAAAIATPLAAASEAPQSLRKRLTFNTKRAYDTNPWDPYLGATKPRIGVVVAAMDITGSDAVGAVILVVTIRDSAGKQQAQSTTKLIERGWGATPDWTVTFDNVARGSYAVTLTATANGCEPITLQLDERTAS
ncbi:MULTISPECIES: hypothetical protein [unclassified Microbacterium]|uniref:hypothetical protein n=1 Tax=unclassified Microbacterium TaxID=2609290 RepID=UPI001443CE59|nr:MULTISPECIES: hypothetical protein [unclassified Microbacterium]